MSSRFHKLLTIIVVGTLFSMVLVAAIANDGTKTTNLPKTKNSLSSSQNSVSGQMQSGPAGWTFYSLSPYKITFYYPAEKWVIEKNLASPLISVNQPLDVENLYSSGPSESEGTIITIAVYASGSKTVFQALQQIVPNIQAAVTGNIDYAIQLLSQGQEDGILTYSTDSTVDLNSAEVGAREYNGGRLSYTTFLQRPGNPFIYAVELLVDKDYAASYAPTYEALIRSISIGR